MVLLKRNGNAAMLGLNVVLFNMATDDSADFIGKGGGALAMFD